MFPADEEENLVTMASCLWNLTAKSFLKKLQSFEFVERRLFLWFKDERDERLEYCLL